MSAVLLQQHVSIPQTKTKTNTTATSTKKQQRMAWSNEKLRFSCIENIGLKQLWKLIALDTNATNTTPSKHKSNSNRNNTNQHISNTNKNNQQQQQQLQQQQNSEKLHIENCVNLADYLTNRDILTPSSMSLLKFLAINALELSAPATPVLLQQQNQLNIQQLDEEEQATNQKPHGWMQLSGHPESIVPTTVGIVRKRVSSLTTDSEVLAYQQISQEAHTAHIVPHFSGTKQLDNDSFIELQDLLAGFKDPCVMDIKLGCRTFLESEVSNKTLRPDLYQKMMTVDPDAPTPEEHAAKAITKLRYMLFREAMSSSQTKGFRIEALRLRGRPPMKDLKTVRTGEQITQTIEQFVGGKRDMHKQLIHRLKHMRSVMEQSTFFQRHEIVGSSIFIVYDDVKVGAWLIDFAKSRQLSPEISVNHRAEWVPGNREEGLLKGMDELIDAFECVYAGNTSRKCLHI